MKIAMIGQKGIPSRAGGVEIHVEEICSRLVERGHEVVVYCRKSHCEGRFERHKGIKLKYIPTINTKHLDAIIYSFLATMNALIKGFDVYHYHALGPSIVSWIPRLLGKKVVCTIHGLDWQRQKWGKFASACLKLGEFCSAYFPNRSISVSETLVPYYKQKYGKDVVFIPNGIEIPDKKEASYIEKEFGIKKDGYILFLARLVPEKGAHYLIEAYKRLKTDKKLVIAGGSSHSDGYVDTLKRLAGNDSNIIFTGFVSGDRLYELFSNAYLYVLPSDIEGMPISLLEAMSFEKVCLVSNIEENMAIVKNYGFSFKKGSVDDLYEKLSAILKNNNGLSEKKKQIYEYITSHFNWYKITDQLERVYAGI